MQTKIENSEEYIEYDNDYYLFSNDGLETSLNIILDCLRKHNEKIETNKLPVKMIDFNNVEYEDYGKIRNNVIRYHGYLNRININDLIYTIDKVDSEVIMKIDYLFKYIYANFGKEYLACDLDNLKMLFDYLNNTNYNSIVKSNTINAFKDNINNYIIKLS